MKLPLLALLALPYIAIGQSVGDIIIQKATISGATEVYVTPSPTKILGLNDSGEPSLISLGAGVTLPSGTLTISPAWSAITGTPTTLAGYGITDGVSSGALTSALTSALADYLTTASAASTYAPLSHSQAWGTITGTPTTLAGYGITDAQPLDTQLTSLATLSGTAGTFPYFSSSNVISSGTITAAGRALIDDASAAAQRATLGLGGLATKSLTWLDETSDWTLWSHGIQLGTIKEVPPYVEVLETGISFVSDTGGGTITPPTFTGGWAWQLPDKSGTFAFTSDLTPYLTSATATSTYQPLADPLTDFAELAATPGALFHRNAAGALELIPPGTAGQVFTMGVSVPAWAAPASSFDPASPGAIGGTTPDAGAFTDLTVSGQSLTGSQATPALNLASTWNTTGNVPFIYGRVTNTASGASSKLIDLGTVAYGPVFTVALDGSLRVGKVGGVDAPKIMSGYSTGNYLDLQSAELCQGATGYSVSLKTWGHAWVSLQDASGSMVVKRGAAQTTGSYPVVGTLHVAGSVEVVEMSTDPANPEEGRAVLWQSDGAGSGDDGDIMFKITAGGVTKIVTLVDFSAF